MSLRSFDLEISSATNPIDVFEDVVSADYDHEVSRVADYELVLNCRGQWTSYEMHCYWQPAQQALHTSCLLEMRVAPPVCRYFPTVERYQCAPLVWAL